MTKTFIPILRLIRVDAVQDVDAQKLNPMLPDLTDKQSDTVTDQSDFYDEMALLCWRKKWHQFSQVQPHS